MPKVKIWTQAYNAEKTLARAIESILAQTYTDFDYFVLNNGSTDCTNDIMLEYARRDNRIKPLYLKHNDLTNGGAFMKTIAYSAGNGWFVWIDADDEYTPDFLESMVRFATDNRLDIAAGGYDKLDGITGKHIKRRVAEKELIFSRSEFADSFIEYRGFMMSWWGKLYSLALLRKVFTTYADVTAPVLERSYDDCSGVLEVCAASRKIGVLPKSVYKYYQYQSSTVRTILAESIGGYKDYWYSAKGFLQRLGEISKKNWNFLYAIHLSLIDEEVEKILLSDMSAAGKLALLTRVFEDEIWPDTLTRQADSQFRNLAERGKYVRRYVKSVDKLVKEANQPQERLLSLITLEGTYK